MNAGEKIAWAELVISLTALVAAFALYPWLGDGAAGAFGLLGLLGGCVIFTRGRGTAVVFDERDTEIHQRGLRIGVFTGWMVGFMGLVAVVLWCVSRTLATAPVVWLVWLVWLQISLCYAVKGLVEVRCYRGAEHAS
ncbi:hypothetical protein Pla123a_01090 [Posidoniimonas polymericola]|uniref:Uncharacterized protein n=1 Tax=Posidoniimonas polymericola TaxID=2528002 RepID=A0A5C5ZD96_9BACT|nr:hypothetical protein [Posidoniimonas polymericola]TWT85302.1 hypothetical protein Pla123a_01090 [Posidoniimonas polymericola]